MAHPLPPGLTPSEVSFLCEMEMVTVVPRGRLDSIDLLSGTTPPLKPPHRAELPLWLALLLKKQRRANILPPAWLLPSSLAEIIRQETREDPQAFSKPPPPPARADGQSGLAHRINTAPLGDNDDVVLSPPFLQGCVAGAPSGYLPYHWLEMAEVLLAHAADDMPAPAGVVRGLLRDLVEARAAKMRASTTQLEAFGGGVINLRGVGAMELAENRGFVLGVVDGVRKLGASAEATRREEEEEGGGVGEDEESDEDMGI
ncbi:GINS complex, PSF2 component [Cryphonectria parasitica EP155]|uniref:DNA replication complex GINS protein PSF2 n=1 Tax=Cryphonectria parasitica (strain ATCC 38755 / EP155) TaxID=660469 RepID=A0A9P4Y6S5_CRYP1|nr:GINS complex, PSF2 component [Cryphonectria parasitica EP155]KAF3767145.1 GINS complex, PSF2 component [Cryphonectria parasitica EP155]